MGPGSCSFIGSYCSHHLAESDEVLAARSSLSKRTSTTFHIGALASKRIKILDSLRQTLCSLKTLSERK